MERFCSAPTHGAQVESKTSEMASVVLGPHRVLQLSQGVARLLCGSSCSPHFCLHPCIWMQNAPRLSLIPSLNPLFLLNLSFLDLFVLALCPCLVSGHCFFCLVLNDLHWIFCVYFVVCLGFFLPSFLPPIWMACFLTFFLFSFLNNLAAINRAREIFLQNMLKELLETARLTKLVCIGKMNKKKQGQPSLETKSNHSHPHRDEIIKTYALR